MTPAATRRAPARWPLFLALVLSLVALATLFWLRGRLVREERAALSSLVRVFERGNLLGRPENAAIRFSVIESTAESYQESDLIARLFVAKRLLDGREVLVHPFWYALDNDAWQQEVAGWERLPVGSADNPAGALYVKLARGNREAVDRTILLFVLFLVLCLGLLVFRQRGKELELNRTVSELERRRAEVIRLERLALAGQLSANIFHDIKKPILNIKHEADDLLAPGTLDPPVRDAVAAMKEQTDLFLRILRELGFEQFVRAEGDSDEYCDVADSLERAVALVRYEQGDVIVERDLPATPPPLVLAPPYRLVQLFSNLVLNAYQAMGGKGLLRLRLLVGEKTIEVHVEDNGPGIAPGIRDTIFEPFASTRADAGGSGLGLYICAQILSDLGGSIRVEDADPRGTRFVITLPVQP
ncbi:MAG: HAMP domain-containing histidine kinase [Candidatus Sumerlaeia bacterium]|nr:HAMP domain-containing histidine kinase [Candidatus Sumerlaeia bacterium]